jgi:hypothetical protein
MKLPSGNAGATQASQEKQDDGVSQGILPEKIMYMQRSILILMHRMPMTTMITLIVLRTITVTLPRPPMVMIDLMCMVMKVKMLMMIKRKAKQKINPELRHPKKKQDDGVSQGLPPQGNHENADTNPDSHAQDAHDNNVHSDSAKNDNSNIALATNGEDRPELHNHEGLGLILGGALFYARVTLETLVVFNIKVP